MRRFSVFLIVCFSIAFTIGCSSDDKGDGLTQKDQEAISRLDQIAKASGGDWDKVSDADKKYLINDVSMGSEQSAKMLLQAKAGKTRRGASGSPVGK